MSFDERAERARARVADALAHVQKTSGPQVGTMVDVRTVRLKECGGFRADAIIGALQAIASASERSERFRALSRILRSDGSIDLWLPNVPDGWRTAVFRLNLEPGLVPSELVLSMTTHIPFGLADDTSAYPVETSTAYKRATQSLHLVTNVHARLTIRTVTEDGNSREQAQSNSQGNEQSRRDNSNQSFSQSHSHGFTHTKRQWPERSDNAEHWTNEKRAEYGVNSEQQSARSESWESRASSTSTQRQSSETVKELSQDISFTAVGIDFTDSERLWKAWRSDPGNREAAVTVEFMLGAVGSLADFIAEKTRTRRLEARSRPELLHGDSFSERFWSEAESLILLDRDGKAWAANLFAQDGRALPIRANEFAEALHAAWPNLQSASQQYQRLVE